MTQFDWTDDRCDAIRAMWLDGASAGQIAGVIGATRNSVIGKIHRLGIKRPATMRQEPAGLASSCKGRKRLETVVPPPKPEPPTRVMVSFVTGDFSERGRCRYIPDDPQNPGWRCCAAAALPGRSYCPAHSRVVFAPARKVADAQADGDAP